MTMFHYPGNFRIGLRQETVNGFDEPHVEMVQAKQNLLLLLNGHQRFCIDGEEFLLSTVVPDDPGPKALLLHIGRESRLEYLESYGSPLVKISISTDPDWLEHLAVPEEEDGIVAPLHAGESTAFAHRSWTPDAHMLALAQDLLELDRAPTNTSRPAQNLALMSRGIELYRAAFQAVAQLPIPAMVTADPKLAALAGYIAAHLGEPDLGPEDLAKACGMGLRSLQRLCRRSLDCSPREFIRAQRLNAAHEALRRGRVNLAQAAHMAGYSSTANFSTAFKREFGLTPGRAQDMPAGFSAQG